MPIKETYIQYGVPSNWANTYEILGISVATFKQTPKKHLIAKYNIPKLQVDFVKHSITRQAIDELIIQQLLEKSNFICCVCRGTKGEEYIIHHIKEYSTSKDNSYKNLAVLCPNDHGLAHQKGNALTNKLTEKQIIDAKNSWEKQVVLENKKRAVKKIIKKDWKKENPFKELQSYTENDKAYFFGRKTESEELLSKIFKYKIVGLFGESGTGKTSLLNAGLIPNFKKSNFITISVRCLDEPIKRVREQLLKSLKENEISAPLIEELASTDTFAHLIIQLKSIVEKENLNLIIIIDQFEELFTRAREEERESLSKGIIEALTFSPSKGKIFFLLSLREDYLGELWDWAHLYKLEDAWIHQYRIKRLNEEMAFEAITQPLKSLGIKTDDAFVLQLISELKNIGDDLIYPPYLQIVCSELFEEYKIQNTDSKPLIVFGKNLYKETDTTESIIADYLSNSMLEGLTEEEKFYAQNILDLLTGPEGLRTFLNTEEISRYLSITIINAQHVIEHLIKKKIVHPLVENDVVIGYELVHDFLSKKFFEKLGPEAKKSKTTTEIFRKAFREFELHGVLASKDRLEILFPNVKQLILNDNEWTFLIKSSFSIYWHWDNRWTTIIESEKLKNISLSLITDKEDRIIENAISALGRIGNKEITPTLIKIIESPQYSISVKDTALHQFSFSIVDNRIVKVLANIIKNEKSHKLRKTAVYAFGKNINDLSKFDKTLIDREINILLEALNDSMTQVRKQAADVLSYVLVSEKAVLPLIERLEKENSISSRKAIVFALSCLLKKGLGTSQIPSILETVHRTDTDYRVKEEALRGLPKDRRELIEKQKTNEELALKSAKEQSIDLKKSIDFAKRLQKAILPSEKTLEKLLPERFILYKPKEVVAGDFYWAEQWGNEVLIAVADCTGHDVRAAFISTIGITSLSNAVNVLGLTKPSLILNQVNKEFATKLNQNEDLADTRDGMDIAVCAINFSKLRMQFSGAYNSMCLIRNNELIEILGDKMPITGFQDEIFHQFTNHELEIQKNDLLYLFTDGFADQFGGENGKKFKFKQLKQVLFANHKKTLSEQRNILEKVFNKWKGKTQQVDDILVIGIKI